MTTRETRPVEESREAITELLELVDELNAHLARLRDKITALEKAEG